MDKMWGKRFSENSAVTFLTSCDSVVSALCSLCSPLLFFFFFFSPPFGDPHSLRLCFVQRKIYILVEIKDDVAKKLCVYNRLM